MAPLQLPKAQFSFNGIKHASSASPISLSKKTRASQKTLPLMEKKKTHRPINKASRSISQLINENPWSSQLELSLMPFASILSLDTITRVLYTIKTPSKALLFFKWVHSRGCELDANTYFRMLEILGRTGNLNSAKNLILSMPKNGLYYEDRFFNSLMRGYGRAGMIQEAIKVIRMMKEFRVAPSVLTYNNLFGILLRRGRTNMVKKLYEDMGREGISPDVYTFNILIRGFCMNSMVDESFWLFNDMVCHGCVPDMVTYNTLLDGLCRAGKVDNARKLFDGLLRKGDALVPNVVTYTTLIRGYCEKRLIGEAMKVYEEMVNGGVKPNNVTYNTLIQGLSEAQKLDKINEILKEIMHSAEFRPDTCTFNTLMNAHCNADRLEDALAIFSKFSEIKVEADSATYSVLIRNLCLRDRFEEAAELLDDLVDGGVLLKPGGCIPLVAGYKHILEYLCKNRKTEKAEIAFRQLHKRGTQDPFSFQILILGHCREGNPKNGFNLLVLMLRRDFVPDVETYLALLKGFIEMRDPIFALKTLERMLRSRHVPQTSIFFSIIDMLMRDDKVREAADTIKMMLERGIRQNINVSTNLVEALFDGGLSDDAFEILQLLYENDYLVKMERLLSFLCEEKRFLEAKQLSLFSLEKHGDLDIGPYSRVIRGLCKTKRTKDAFSLYYEMVERGRQPDEGCLRELMAALNSEGRLKEAEFVAKLTSRSRKDEQ
ncbi:pentatricopeptide repeat-containing protein At1g02060, chloroplastic [Amborella trichopoda]|uniref:Pentacotripeptide-repeat region of PRORP domain-containing protein n=1 Tax=Amborella trichopoda TaxID=13333 RepID=W1NWQ9_AMBTC|nr:pentatricopeptide repeat-containing protein At1g02060, chloroplastic [Amborella trichopoda]ERM99700.1 hypothetical protein AMTR_s00099p00074160 [Amborella trichopoda]|eukprot:XP_006836847.1 pentatricopeptide repeat-containing protein At1g02060, chloroplastic [Amborella trichopoda]